MYSFRFKLKKSINSVIALLILCSFSSCNAQTDKKNVEPFDLAYPGKFMDYWYAGNAELDHYDLKQMRYGEPRNGDAVLIYVTEDFLPEKQVKKEFGDKPGISVLKLNFTKKFITGIYDYAIMTSIFTPVEFRKHPATLKASFSSQDWCGQSFSQMNLRNQKLNYQTRSYFQAEGDTNTAIPATYIEEDVWTRIRIEPQTLPLGKIEMIPSMEYIRLNHKDLKPYHAIANLMLQVNDTSLAGPSEFYVYTVRYPDLDRELKIKCQTVFPFKIFGWEEIQNASNPAKKETTTATLTNTLIKPYWNLNHNENQSLRDSLGIHYRME